MWGYGYGPSMMSYGGFGFINLIFSVFWIVILVWVIAMVVRALRGKPVWRGEGIHLGNSALDILKERYAKGEIDRQEFEEKKKDLSA